MIYKGTEDPFLNGFCKANRRNLDLLIEHGYTPKVYLLEHASNVFSEVVSGKDSKKYFTIHGNGTGDFGYSSFEMEDDHTFRTKEFYFDENDGMKFVIPYCETVWSLVHDLRGVPSI